METNLPTPIWQGPMLIYWRVISGPDGFLGTRSPTSPMPRASFSPSPWPWRWFWIWVLLAQRSGCAPNMDELPGGSIGFFWWVDGAFDGKMSYLSGIGSDWKKWPDATAECNWRGWKRWELFLSHAWHQFSPKYAGASEDYIACPKKNTNLQTDRERGCDTLVCLKASTHC